MEKFNPKDFAAIIVDEAHHATSPSYRKVVDWYMQGNPNYRLLGVTATPDRADELALGTVFEKVAASYDVADAIRDGWLVPIEQRLRMGDEGCGTNDGEWRRQLIAKSSKPSCLVLDFVGNSGRHKLITSADILGGKYPDEVVERARRKAARKTVNMSDALEEARLEYEEIERRKNADAARRKAIRAIAPFCLTKVNPFDAYDLPPVPVRSGEPPRRYSPNQARFLREYFQIDPERLPYVQGKQLLDEYGRRKNAGLASLKQVRLLRRKGVPVPMRFDEARRVLDRLVG